MPFAAEAQGFGTCDLEQAVVSVGFQIPKTVNCSRYIAELDIMSEMDLP